MPIITGGRGDVEVTSVSTETEVLIPWQTYKKLLILGPIGIWCSWAAGWTTWMVIATGKVSAWYWFTRRWCPWFARWWGLPLIMCFLWWASAPTWATIYRYILETVTKTQPAYDRQKPGDGMWFPWTGWKERRIRSKIQNQKLQWTYDDLFDDEEEDDEWN